MPELGCDADLPPEGGKSFPSQKFIAQGAVDDGRIKKSNSALHGLMKKPDALLTRGRLAAVVGHSHDSEAKGRSFQSTGALAKRPAPGGGKAAVFRRIGTPALCPGNGRRNQRSRTEQGGHFEKAAAAVRIVFIHAH